MIVRMVVSPMHVHSKKRELKSNFFSHAFTRGLSVQRSEHASAAEFVNLVSGFVGPDDKRAWLGYVEISAGALRAVQIDEKPANPFCVYDAAERDYPCHAEIGIGYKIEEADEIEFRRHLLRICGDGTVHRRQLLRDGEVWEGLPADIRDREIPAHWQ